MNGIVLLIEAVLALILIASFAPLTKTSLQNDFADLIEEKKLGDLSKAVTQDSSLSNELIEFGKDGFAPPLKTMDLASQVSSKCFQVEVTKMPIGLPRPFGECESKRTRLKSIATLFDGNDFYTVRLILAD